MYNQEIKAKYERKLSILVFPNWTCNMSVNPKRPQSVICKLYKNISIIFSTSTALHQFYKEESKITSDDYKAVKNK